MPGSFQAAILDSAADVDAQAYFAAVGANGGSIGGVARRAVTAFVRGLKADGLWDSLLDVGLFAGVDNLNAAMVKLKTPSGVQRVLTNNNFVTSDYSRNAGLTGDAATKYLNTGFNPADLSSSSDFHISAYVTTAGSASGSRALISAEAASNTNAVGLGRYSSGTVNTLQIAIATGTEAVSAGNNSAGLVGHWLGTCNSSRSQAFYINGSASGTPKTASGNFPNKPIFVFASNAMTSLNFVTDRTLTFYSLGHGLSATQAAAFTARVNALMRAFGANVF